MAWMGGVDVRRWDSDQLYYVIVGCGLTAAVNYTTLLAAMPGRLADCPVLFIGEEEPWSRYAPLPMGQWPAVLSAPSFRDQLRGAAQDDFVPSDMFARSIDRQWQRLFRVRPFAAIAGRVQALVERPHGFDIDIGRPDIVRARFVDVCGGPGPARRLCDHQVDSTLRPYPTPAPGPRGWRLLETGESFLERGVAVPGGGRIAVVGGGPTAAWCVERALAAGNDVDWVSDSRLNPAFVSSLRNDRLAQPLNRFRRNRQTVVTQLVYPASPRLRFAEGYDVDRVVGRSGGVELSFRQRGPARYVDSTRARLGPLVPTVFDQAVIAIGQETGTQKQCRAPCGLWLETHSWATMLQPLLTPAFTQYRHLILDPMFYVALGVHTVGGSLGVLGTAFLAHPDAQRLFRNPRSPLFRYHASLCEQGQVDRGAAISSYTTARANGWFQFRGNRNRNSATLDELQASGLNRDHARRWLAIRGYRVDPLTNAEARDVSRVTRDR